MCQTLGKLAAGDIMGSKKDMPSWSLHSNGGKNPEQKQMNEYDKVVTDAIKDTNRCSMTKLESKKDLVLE